MNGYNYPNKGIFYLSKEDFIKLCKHFDVYSIDELREKLNKDDIDTNNNKCVYGYYKPYKNDKGLWEKDYSCPVRTNLPNIDIKTLKQYCNNCERVIKLKAKPITIENRVESNKYRKLTDAEWDEVYSYLIDRYDCKCYLCGTWLVEWSDARKHCWDKHPDETKQAMKKVLNDAKV
ncbi:MAG: hypothetical protein KatS3mg003_1160 [Candidatus Nitrosocaldaceae archaeon]|nr:MAG: hypothetical protein KatS3mg003_1160 [Candidatus Nitrosocaldaceae archaeon]